MSRHGLALFRYGTHLFFNTDQHLQSPRYRRHRSLLSFFTLAFFNRDHRFSFVRQTLISSPCSRSRFVCFTRAAPAELYTSQFLPVEHRLPGAYEAPARRFPPYTREKTMNGQKHHDEEKDTLIVYALEKRRKNGEKPLTPTRIVKVGSC